jgi:hypothetical protein
MIHSSIKALLLIAPLTLLNGCAKTSTSPSDTSENTPAGVLQATISPSPLPPNGAISFGQSCRVPAQFGWGPFTITLRETAGGTVTVDYWTWEGIDAAGNSQYIQTLTGALGVNFAGASGSSVQLQPHASVTSRTITDCELVTFAPGGRLHMVFRGLDGKGGATTAEVDVQLLPF